MPRTPTPRSHFSSDELLCLSRLQQQGKSPSEVATLMDRHISSVCRRFDANKSSKKVKVAKEGRPKALTEAQVDRLVKTANNMIAAADSKYQVTAKMLKDSLKLKCCLRN